MGICDGANAADINVEYSTDPSKTPTDVTHTWVDIDAVSGVLDVTGGDKSAASFVTFAGPVVGLSQSGVQNVNLTVVFENDTTSFLEYVTDLWDETVANPCFYIRWTYDNSASGALQRVAKVALLTNPFTGGDPASAGPITKALVFAVDGDITRVTLP